MRSRPSRWLGVLLLCAGCAASGTRGGPPAPGPAPSPAAITNLGMQGAVKAGSDYVAASTTVPNPTLTGSRTLPSGMVQLDFDLGPGIPEPVRVTVDPNSGNVHSLEPVQQVPSISSPAKTSPAKTR